jgi:hypothetical protein
MIARCLGVQYFTAAPLTKIFKLQAPQLYSLLVATPTRTVKLNSWFQAMSRCNTPQQHSGLVGVKRRHSDRSRAGVACSSRWVVHRRDIEGGGG